MVVIWNSSPAPLAVAGGDDRRVQQQEAARPEELVHGQRQPVTDTRHGPESGRARAQVRQLAEPLEADALLAERILPRIAVPQHAQADGAQLDALLPARRGRQAALGDDRRAGMQAPDLVGVVRQGGVGDDLQVRQAGAVVQLDEGESPLGVAPRPHPAGDGDVGLLAGGRAQQLADAGAGAAHGAQSLVAGRTTRAPSPGRVILTSQGLPKRSA